MSRGLGLKMVHKLKHLDSVCDAGLLSGTQERREAKALIRELRAMAAQVNKMETQTRIDARQILVLTLPPKPSE